MERGKKDGDERVESVGRGGGWDVATYSNEIESCCAEGLRADLVAQVRALIGKGKSNLQVNTSHAMQMQQMFGHVRMRCTFWS
jgi:hypothetical protein